MTKFYEVIIGLIDCCLYLTPIAIFHAYSGQSLMEDLYTEEYVIKNMSQ